jgi:hypothetical protein
MTTRDSGEIATFIFTGTKVELFGAKRSGYGQYQITANEKPYPVRDASNETDVFQTSLWSFDWPVITERTIKMTNMAANRAIDLDFVCWRFLHHLNTFANQHPRFLGYFLLAKTTRRSSLAPSKILTLPSNTVLIRLGRAILQQLQDTLAVQHSQSDHFYTHASIILTRTSFLQCCVSGWKLF